MHETLAILIGIGLSATCGFRIFVPLLGMSIANHYGFLPLSTGFEWVGSQPAMIALAVATLLEIGAYSIPWLDNLLDTIATPGAVIAGTIATASVVGGDISPFVKWSLAVIAGGGVAGIIQGSSALVRGTSTAATGGVANPVVSILELLAAVMGTFLSIALPVIAVILVGIILFFIFRRVHRLRIRQSA
ncbi:DUF4126 domain-containing protein [bacterium]|nr:DUF4126 domain-containing protein [candidate division CSSED10-310 bacterium]